MADVTRDDKGNITRIVYRDYSDYSLEIEPPTSSGRVRIWSKNKQGTGSPVDLTSADARRAARDILDWVGEGD